MFRTFFYTVFLAYLFSGMGWAQTITFSGRVLDKRDKNDTLFYTFNQEEFRPQQYVLIENKTYVFSLTKAQIEKQDIREIVFLADRTVQPNERYACIHRIYLSQIIALKDNLSKPTTIQTDLSVFDKCSASPPYGAETEGLKRFVGEYQLMDGNGYRMFSLSDMFFKLQSYLPFQDENMMIEEIGVWNYSQEKKILTLSVYERQNRSLGLLLRQSKQYRFEVVEENGQLIFKSDTIKLAKL